MEDPLETWAELASRIKWHSWRSDAVLRERLVLDLCAVGDLRRPWAEGLLPALAALIDAVPGHQADIGQSTRLFGMRAGAVALGLSHGAILRARIGAVRVLTAGGEPEALAFARALTYWVADHDVIANGEVSASLVAGRVFGPNAGSTADRESDARVQAFVRHCGALVESGEVTPAEADAVRARLLG